MGPGEKTRKKSIFNREKKVQLTFVPYLYRFFPFILFTTNYTFCIGEISGRKKPRKYFEVFLLKSILLNNHSSVELF